MKKRKLHIVIVSTWYPPVTGVAVNRIYAFAKYLDKQKYHVSVISLATQNSMMYEREDGIQIYRLENTSLFKLPKFNKPVSKPHHYLKVIWKLALIKFLKDESVVWEKKATALLLKLSKEKTINIIISSYPTLAAHKVALNIVKENPKIKWIADMRDEMSRNPFLSESEKIQLKKNEQDINNYAVALTTVSRPILDDFRKDFNNIMFFEEIRNGFDNEYLNTYTSSTFNKEFRMLYAGTFYGKRKPNTFLKALSGLEEKGLMPANWEFRLIGSAHNFTIPANIKNHIVFVNHLPQKHSEKEMQQADVNVFIHPNMGTKGVFSGKLFDYLSAGKPVLAITDKEDVAAELIINLKAGYVAEFDSVKEISEKVLEAVNNWNKRIELPMDIDGIKKLHRKYQVKKLELLIERIMDNE